MLSEAGVSRTYAIPHKTTFRKKIVLYLVIALVDVFRKLHNLIPLLDLLQHWAEDIASLRERVERSNDYQLVLGSGNGNVQSSKIFQQPSTSSIRITSHQRKNDSWLVSSLVTIDRAQFKAFRLPFLN